MKINPSIAVSFCFLFLFSCRKEKTTVIEEVPVIHSWSLDSSLFGLDKILLTSLSLNDSTLAVANSSVIWYINSNKLNSSIDGAFINFNPVYGYLLSPNITKTIGTTLIDSNRLKIFSTLAPVDNFGEFTFTPVYTNAAYSVKGFPLPAFPCAGYPVINSKYILAPTEIDYTNEKAYCSLVTVDFSSVPIPNALHFVSSKTLTLSPGPLSPGFSDGGYFSATYYNKFFLSYNNQFYRIDTLGNVKAFGFSPVPQEQNGRVAHMFIIGNYLFAAGYSKFFVSQDEGESWSLFSDATGSLYTSFSYFNVGNELYAAYGSQLWRVKLNGTALNYQELDNDGLQTNQITSINKTGKFVFVTTLAGLYYRDTGSFNTPKK